MPRANSPIPVRKIAAGNDIYKRGYHKGDPGGLDAIETDLATANIKNGVVIFGKAGSTNVRDSSDANAVLADVRNTKTFYAGGGARKTGNMPTVALAPGSSAYPAGYHVGDGGGLPAIDADLAAGNIKDGITIFGVLGTFSQALAYDTEGKDVSDDTDVDVNRTVHNEYTAAFGPAGGITVLTKTITCAQATVVHGFCAGGFEVANTARETKLRFYIDGVLQEESARIDADNQYHTYSFLYHKSCASGARIVKLDAYNYDGSGNQALHHTAGLSASCDKTA